MSTKQSANLTISTEKYGPVIADGSGQKFTYPGYFPATRPASGPPVTIANEPQAHQASFDHAPVGQATLEQPRVHRETASDLAPADQAPPNNELSGPSARSAAVPSPAQIEHDPEVVDYRIAEMKRFDGQGSHPLFIDHKHPTVHEGNHDLKQPAGSWTNNHLKRPMLRVEL